MLKNIIKFIICLLPWFLSTLICNDYSFFKEINIPSFAIPQNLFGIAWFTLYTLISISVVITSNNYLTNKYKLALLINYIFNQLYTIVFFCFQNIFLGFVVCLITFITSLFLYFETKEISKFASKFIIPYTLFLLYASILSLAIYFINV